VSTADAIWAAYAATRLLVDAAGRPLLFEPDEAGKCGDWTLAASSLHVVTAWNPRSVALTDAENRARQARLQSVVDLLGYRSLDVIVQAVSGDWPAEPGLGLVDVTRPRAVALGVLFDQTAVFELTPAALRVVGCFEDRVLEGGWRLVA
jgi:hypothetical protein